MAVRIGSLFAGMGGFDLAFERAGASVAWQVECDKHARRVLARHWSRVECCRDVRGFSRRPRRLGHWLDRWERPDIVVGGFPCQDLSVAGKRAGLAGARSGMWWQMLRIINGLRPCVVVFENVPGLFSSDGGRDFARVVGSLGERGYFGSWRVLDAQHFGVPQRRRRVFGVFARLDPGVRGRLAEPARGEVGRRLAVLCAEVLALGEGGEGHPAARRTPQEDVAAALAGGVDGTGRVGTFTELGEGHATYQETTQASAERTPAGGGGTTANLIAIHLREDPIHGEVSPAITAGRGEGRIGVFQASGSGQFREGRPSQATADDNGSNQLVVGYVTPRICRNSDSCNELGIKDGSIADSLSTDGPGAVVAFAQNQRDEVRDLGDLAGSLASQPGMKQQTYIAHCLRGEGADASEDGTGRGTPLGTSGVGMVRRLTPVECLRLQGFPDDWLDGLRLADSVKYRLCGNAVAVPVVEWIARRLLARWQDFLEAIA